jgi:hypothetical protein
MPIIDYIDIDKSTLWHLREQEDGSNIFEPFISTIFPKDIDSIYVKTKQKIPYRNIDESLFNIYFVGGAIGSSIPNTNFVENFYS